MTKPELKKLIKKIQSFGVYEPPSTPLSLVQRCSVIPRLTWEPELIETTFKCDLHQELKELWNLTSGLILFEDLHYRQWGLVIWSPDQALVRHQRYSNRRLDDFEKGDLIVGDMNSELR